MKRLLLITINIFWIAIQLMFAQSNNQNYIMTTTYLDEAGNSSLKTIQYYDGLGRPVQTVQAGITPNSYDLVSYQEYDSFGRDSTSWLPRVKSGNNGNFVDLNTFKSLSTAIYQNDSKPYSLPVYEPSPLNRVIKQFGPGESWYSGNGHPVLTDYKTNSLTDNALKCIYFYVSGDNLVRSDYYAAGQLYVTDSKDEDGYQSYQFTDKLGRVVLTRQLLAATATTASCVDTYYVYDDVGNLRFVIPPLATDALTGNGTWTEADNTLKKYAYLYRYDERRRCTEKRIPGCDWQYMVYDKADRLILSQDGQQRIKSQWLVNKYDNLGRLLYTGMMNNNGSRQTLQNTIRNWIVTESYVGSADFASTGYSCTYFSNQITPLLVNYYDDYSFLSLLPQAAADSLTYRTMSDYSAQYANAKGLLTGTRSCLLDGSDKYLTTAVYYDSKEQIVQTHSTNHLNGYNHIYNKLSFTGKPLKTLKRQYVTFKYYPDPTAYSLTTNELYENSYDHADRLTNTTYQINNKPLVTLVGNIEYDDLGRLKKKYRHNGEDTEQFEYNLRNWATKITSGDFVENIYYNTNSLSPAATPYYNGNISAVTWNYNGKTNGYLYYYDRLNRMTSNYSILNNYVQVDYQYFEGVSYDKHGNISGINRWHDTDIIDQVSFSHDGNQLKTANDMGGNSNLYNVKEYKDRGSNSEKFTYDANGNMIRDFDRNIVAIRYNYLNLSDTIQFGNGNQIINRYDAAGQKLETCYFTVLYSVTVPIGETRQWTYNMDIIDMYGTAYIDNIEYGFHGGDYGGYSLSRVHNPEGYCDNVIASSNSPMYNYYRRDYQGNNREVWRAAYTSNNQVKATSTIQRTQYYPSGLPWREGLSPAVQPYKYNDKEFVEMHGFDTYDYGARGYYPAAGRFMTIDPLCEKYYSISPYAYCANNPVNAIDPEGEDYWSTNDPEKIRQFINSVGSGANYFDFSNWNHMTDGQFANRLSYNDETGKYWISYGTVENGEAVINSRSFDANITPVSTSGEGYPGAFVYEPRSGFLGNAQDILGRLLDRTQYDTYDNGTDIWNVNSSGRIIEPGFRYYIGYPPAVGKAGKISTKGMPHGDGGRALTQAERKIVELEKQLKTATGKEKGVIQQKIKNIYQDAQKKARGETHWRR